ncbi:hypothetical protein HYH03_015714 [Edaphochlamys debaryana]|uniref:ORC1/DEAH AAA+ ATPase domain-containing protein n=1 Tax=Edaphochlamys debaryana TaxID=47281 RepID=A0A836BQL7_9CHLO|nr:hypothetical protein HYH03_015714 [Edaphochlamys debaryana]|eukprot:KAG2485546.1 hypothetical protein HYH03_015714 [Edaphochlamys debaryana]
MAVGLAFSAIAALVAAVLYGMSGTTRYVPDACSNVGTFLSSHVVGQDLAINQLVDAICEHLLDPLSAKESGAPVLPKKPLIISVHGPPGVGKTYTHTLLARALYNKDASTAVDCPGSSCQGSKVLYGMSYVESERASQLDAVRNAVMDHLRSTPNPLLVVEEYDKLDCDSRALLRQLVRHPELANATMNKAIVLLESNLGFLELEAMLTAAGGDKGLITAEAAESRLREVVMAAWRRNPCESLEDTLAFSSTIDFFLPFFPLTRPEITVLMAAELRSHYAPRLGALGAALSPEPEAVEWLVDRVDFAGGSYPIEGAKQVSTVCVKHVSRLVRRLQEELRAGHGTGEKHGHGHGGVTEYLLGVAPGGRELQLRKADAVPLGHA